MDFSFEVPPIRLRADFFHSLGSIDLYALILRATLLRALSCLLFNRADSVSHYDSDADALHHLLWCYSATTTVASFLIEDPNTGVLSTESSRRHGSGHTVPYDLRRLCQPLLHCAGLTDIAAGNLTALRAVSNL